MKAPTPLPPVASFQPTPPGQMAPPVPPGGPQSFQPGTPARPVPMSPAIAQPAQLASTPSVGGSPVPAGAGMAAMPAGRQPIEVVRGRQGIIQAGASGLEGFESIVATSRAAERWRESWRLRQHDEAGPATSVSRGQASVPRPLMAMQYSFARMRAIILPKQEKQGKGGVAFWIAVLLMICIILGLGAYIVSTYLPENGQLASQVSSSSSREQPGIPVLSVSGTPAATVTQGQVLHVQGKNFAVGDSIGFLLDTTLPIDDADGHPLTATVSNQGTFDVAIPITTSSIWSAGTHMIEAVDNHTRQNAYLNITVMLGGTPTTAGPFTFLLQDQPVTQLSFTGVAGQDDPAPQYITLKNTTGIPYYWNATAFTGDNVSWLHIDDDHTGGLMQAYGSDTLGIGVSLSGLKSSTKPYSGSIVFTLNNNGSSQQLTLPVELLVEDVPAEMVFSPNPVVGVWRAGNICNTGSSLTLINLGTSVITWNVNLDANAQGHVMFTLNGKTSSSLQGELAPGATVTLALACTNVQVDQVYHMTISGNGAQYSDFVSIQSTPD